MSKVVSICAIAFNGIVWLNTFDSQRESIRSKRPEIRQEIEKQKALDTLANQKKEAESILGSYNDSSITKLNVSDEQLLKEIEIISGVMAGKSTAGEEVSYLVEILTTKTPEDSIEPNVWKSQIFVLSKENLHIISTYNAKPIITQGVVNWNLEPTDKAKILMNYNSEEIKVPLKKIGLTIDSQSKVIAGGEDEFGAKWQAKFEKVNSSTVESILGKWKGNFPDNIPAELDLKREGSNIVGDITYKHDVGICKGKVKGLIQEAGKFIIIGGPINDHSACIGNFAIKFKNQGDNLIGGYYDYSTQEAREFKLTR